MPPVAGAIMWGIGYVVGAAIGIAQSIGMLYAGLSFIGKVLVTLAVNVVGKALTKKTEGKQRIDQGTELRLKLDPSMPRQIMLGQTATGGSLVWAFTYTDDAVPNKYLVRVVQLNDFPSNGVVKVMVGKTTLTWDGDLNTGWRSCTQYRSKAGAVCLQMRVYPGVFSGATADANLVSWSGGVWTTNHKGTGLCYAVYKMTYDADAFPQGEPEFIYEMQGAKVYDDRKDGSKPSRTGTHRLNNQSTWEYSDNTALLTAQLLRGFSLNGVLIMGSQADTRDLEDGMLLSAYNTCDQTVNIVATGGTEKKYRAGLITSATDNVGEALIDLQAAMDGRVLDRGGQITLLPGATRTPVFNLTDDDFVWANEKSWQPKASLEDLYNSVAGTFVDAYFGYTEQPFPILTNGTWEIDDGGQRLTQRYTFRAITSWTQVQRMAKRLHQASRFQATVAFTMPIAGIEAEQGDWITITSTRWGMTNKYFEIYDATITQDCRYALICREVSTSIDSWTPASDEHAREDVIWNPPSYDLPIPAFTVDPLSEDDAATGTKLPTLIVTITNIPPFSVISYIEMEIAYTSDLLTATPLPPIQAAQKSTIIRGLLPNTNYSVRLRSSDGRRTSNWSTWQADTTPTQFVAANTAYVGAYTAAAVNAGWTYSTGWINGVINDLIAKYGSGTTIQGTVIGQGNSIWELQATAGSPLNLDPVFYDYPTTPGYPTGWTNWNGSAPTRVTTGARKFSPYGVRVLGTAAGNGGLFASFPPASLPVQDYVCKPDELYTMEAEITLVSGTLAGAGILVQIWDATNNIVQQTGIIFATDKDSTGVVVGNGTTGRSYKFSKTIKMPALSAYFKFYLMSHWSGFGSIASANSIDWWKCSIKLSSAADAGVLVTNDVILTNLAAQATANSLLYARMGTAEAINANASFGDWLDPTLFPSSWVNWSNASIGVSATRNTGAISPYAIDIENAGVSGTNDYGIKTIMTSGIVQGKYILEVEIDLMAGTLSGAGAYVSFRNQANTGIGDFYLHFATTPDNRGTVHGAGTVGKRYRWAVEINVTLSTAWQAELYAMAHWTGFGGSGSNRKIRFHKVALRVASTPEAYVSINQTAIATLEGEVYGSYTLKVVAGNVVTGMELLASSGSTTISAVRFTTGAFLINDGSTNKQIFAVTAGGLEVESAFIGSIRTGAVIRVGTGAGVKVALQSFQVTGTDGASLVWPADLGNVPTYLPINTATLAPLSGTEQYNCYLQSVTATGATLRLRKNTPGSYVTNTRASGQANGFTGGRYMAKTYAADAYNQVYKFRIQGSGPFMVTEYTDEEGHVSSYISVSTGYFNIYFHNGSSWTLATTIGVDVTPPGVWYPNVLTSGAIDQVIDISYSGALGSGGYFGVEPADADSAVSELYSVVWLSNAASGDATAAPNGETVTVTIIPQNF